MSVDPKVMTDQWWSEARLYRPVLSDITVIVGHEKRVYKLHKIVLISQSEFFNVACTNELFAEAQTSTVSLPDINPDAFEVVIHWLYSGTLQYKRDIEDLGRLTHPLEEDSVGQTLKLIEAANFLVIPPLKDVLWDAIAKDSPFRYEDYHGFFQWQFVALGRLYGYRSGSCIDKWSIKKWIHEIHQSKANSWREFVCGIQQVQMTVDLSFEFMMQTLLVVSWLLLADD